MKVKFYWPYFEGRLNHVIFPVHIFKMSYSLPATFLLVILLILGKVQYAKRWYKVLKKRKDHIGKMKEKCGSYSRVRLVCVQGTVLCCKFSCNVEGCDACEGWQ